MRLLPFALLALPLVAARPSRQRRACRPGQPTTPIPPMDPPTPQEPTEPTQPETPVPPPTPNTNATLMRGFPDEGIRGVNLGSWLLIEPWMMESKWREMGGESCGPCNECVSTEFDLVKKLGQEKADEVFAQHWDSFITEEDVNLLKKYKLNSVRIPLGYWIAEHTVNRDIEYFPRGGLDRLRKISGLLADAGISILLDLHAAPGGSTAMNAFAGRCVTQPYFWEYDDNKERHLEAARYLTELVHTEPEHFRSVFALEALNEPPQDGAVAKGYAEFMKKFVEIVRAEEAKHGVTEKTRLLTAFMDVSWVYKNNEGMNPAYAANGGSMYDKHTYLNWGGAYGPKMGSGDSVDEHIRYACMGDGGQLEADVADHNDPVVVGEFWLLGKTTAILDNMDKNNMQRWSDAQRYGRSRQAGKGGSGYYFWSFKLLNDDNGGWTRTRSYKDAVEQGYIPEDSTTYFNPNICDGI